MYFLSKNCNPVNVFEDFFDFPFVNFNQLMLTDVREEKDAYIFDIEMPGFNKEDIKISVDNEYLNIKAEKEVNKEDKKQYIMCERQYSKLERSYYVGKIDEANIKATYNNGILTINVPKLEKVNDKKYIMIE